jgi:hypothetical protein
VPGFRAGSVLELAPQLPLDFERASTNRHAVNGPCLLLRPLANLSREIVLADSELFIYVNEFLAGVLEEESSSQQEEGREQIAEEQYSVQANGPSVLMKDYLPVRNQEFEAIHHQKAKGHEENQREE